PPSATIPAAADRRSSTSTSPPIAIPVSTPPAACSPESPRPPVPRHNGPELPLCPSGTASDVRGAGARDTRGSNGSPCADGANLVTVGPRSSAGQSRELIIPWSSVQVRPGAPLDATKTDRPVSALILRAP